MGVAGRQRTVEHFGWDAVAERTAELYRSLVAPAPAAAPAADPAAPRRRDAVFGDVLPESTADDRDPGSAPTGSDEWLRSQVPPHHGS
jgi:hypothetical protein